MRNVMRGCLALAVIGAASPVRAEITSLGGLRLGQELKSAAPKKDTVFGCAGTISPSLDRAKKVIEVHFEPKECNGSKLSAAIAKELGRAQLVSRDGDQLWEDASAAILLIGVRERPTAVLLRPPAGGTRRVCFADDGFAAFWTSFTQAVASGKPAAIAPAFAFPLKDYDDRVKLKNARAFEGKWKEILSDEDVAALASGETTPVCSASAEEVRLSLDGTYSELIATRKDGVWKWTQWNGVSPD